MRVVIARTNRRLGIRMKMLDSFDLQLKVGKAVTEDEINSFLNRHRRWILNRVAENNAKAKILASCDGISSIRLHGKVVAVHYVEGIGNSSYDGDKVTIYYNGDKKKAIDDFVRDYSREYLTRMFRHIAGDVVPLKIKSVKTYYGVCYRREKGTYICLNSKLIQGDDSIIRYVIHHELTHLKVANHGREFYSELERVEPNYRDIERSLKTIIL